MEQHMSEQTTPEAGVEQATPSVLDRMQSFLGQEPESPDEKPEQATQEQEQPESQAASDELTPDDIPDEPADEQPAVDAFEIVHNGQQHKLTREETIKYAQQGFDYTAKTQAVAEQSKTVTERLQRLEQIEQAQPVLAQSLAQVTAIGAQLQQYQAVDWVQLATESPLDYPAHRARFDQLNNAYNAAANQYTQQANAIGQEKQRLTAQMLQQEAARIPELIPAWKDPAKAEAGKKEITDFLKASGVDMSTIGRYLDTAFAMSVVYKAAQYDKLQRGKADKVKQLRPVPPVTRPGASNPSGNADRNTELRQRLHKSGNKQDAVALLLNRMK